MGAEERKRRKEERGEGKGVDGRRLQEQRGVGMQDLVEVLVWDNHVRNHEKEKRGGAKRIGWSETLAGGVFK